jgi:hypothetical protein
MGLSPSAPVWWLSAIACGANFPHLSIEMEKSDDGMDQR